MSSSNNNPTEEEIKATGLQGDELVDYVAKRKGLQPMPEKTTDDLSGDVSKQAPLDMNIMKKGRPYYPYLYSKEDCPRCKLLSKLKIGHDHGWKLICSNKETGGRITIMTGGNVCDDCGRKYSFKIGEDFKDLD